MVDDNPQDLVHDIAAEAVFGAHPLGRPVIGSAEVIANVSPRALRSWHGGAYVGSNIVLAAAGNLRHERLVELFSRRRPKGKRASRVHRRPLGRLPKPGYRFLRRRTEQYHVVLAAPGIARDDDRRYAASLLDAILGGSASSRLFQEIREKRGMAYSVYTYGSQYAETRPGGDLRRHARGQPPRVPRRDRGRARGRRGRQPPAGRARACEGEPRGPAAPVAREHVEPDDPPRSRRSSPTPSSSPPRRRSAASRT